jgi:phosphatidylglycerol---prolipoprotein diacylglyceryl transferase
MITVPIDPIIFSIGHIHLRWYSLIVMTAIMVGLFIAAKEAARKGFREDDIYENAIWIVFAGILGARLFHVIDHWPNEFASNPISAIYIWDGGLAIWGGVLGGLAGLAVLAWHKSWKLSRLLDAFVPGVVLGQAVGRVACIITGDTVGKPTTGPLGLAYSSPNAMAPKLGVYYTPIPIYEIIVNLVIFGILWALHKKRFPDGALSLIYMILYSIGRFFISFASSYQLDAFGLTQAQIISILVLVVSLPLLAFVYHRYEKQLLNSSNLQKIRTDRI